MTDKPWRWFTWPVQKHGDLGPFLDLQLYDYLERVSEWELMPFVSHTYTVKWGEGCVTVVPEDWYVWRCRVVDVDDDGGDE